MDQDTLHNTCMHYIALCACYSIISLHIFVYIFSETSLAFLRTTLSDNLLQHKRVHWVHVARTEKSKQLLGSGDVFVHAGRDTQLVGVTRISEEANRSSYFTNVDLKMLNDKAIHATKRRAHFH